MEDLLEGGFSGEDRYEGANEDMGIKRGRKRVAYIFKIFFCFPR